MGPAAGRRHRRRPAQPDEHHTRRRLPDLQGRIRRLRPRALLRPRPPHRRHGRAPVRHRDLEPQTRRTRLSQALRRLPGRDRAHRAADGDPGQDHQGMDPRLPLREPQLHPPDEEADPRRSQGLPGPAVPGHPRLGARRGEAALLPARRRTHRSWSTCTSGGAPSAATCPRAECTSKPLAAARRGGVRRSPGAAQAGKRSPPRWRSSGYSRTS